MKNLILFFLIGLGTSLLSCDRATDSTDDLAPEAVFDNPIAITDMHNSMNALDWNGTYKGILPCAACEGIETTLTLNSDKSYILVTNYLGRNDALEQEKRGQFSWNEDGSIITLTNIDSAPNQYKVGETRIWQLNVDGKLITGDLADHYVLTKSL
jgi:uncharacterized lipoprotein NlpE involved in copper resistance